MIAEQMNEEMNPVLHAHFTEEETKPPSDLSAVAQVVDGRGLEPGSSDSEPLLQPQLLWDL